MFTFFLGGVGWGGNWVIVMKAARFHRAHRGNSVFTLSSFWAIGSGFQTHFKGLLADPTGLPSV